jgi:hypothetical protein
VPLDLPEGSGSSGREPLQATQEVPKYLTVATSHSESPDHLPFGAARRSPPEPAGAGLCTFARAWSLQPRDRPSWRGSRGTRRRAARSASCGGSNSGTTGNAATRMRVTMIISTCNNSLTVLHLGSVKTRRPRAPHTEDGTDDSATERSTGHGQKDATRRYEHHQSLDQSQRPINPKHPPSQRAETNLVGGWQACGPRPISDA